MSSTITPTQVSGIVNAGIVRRSLVASFSSAPRPPVGKTIITTGGVVLITAGGKTLITSR